MSVNVNYGGLCKTLQIPHDHRMALLNGIVDFADMADEGAFDIN